MLIREAAERVLSGETLGALVRDFNTRSIPTTKGNTWSVTTMKRMLVSGRISGQRDHQPRSRQSPVRKIVGETVGRAQWDAIITPAQTARLRAVLLDPQRRLNGGQARKYLLTGILHCGICGAGLNGRPKEDGTPRYVCAKIPGNQHCGKIYVRAPEADAFVVAMVGEALNSEEFFKALTQEPEGNEQDVFEGYLLDQEKLDQLARDYATGLIGRSEWLAARGVLEQQLAVAKGRLAKTSSTLALHDLVGGTFAENFRHLTFSQQRAVLTAVLVQVDVMPAVRGLNRFDPTRFRPTWRV